MPSLPVTADYRSPTDTKTFQPPVSPNPPTQSNGTATSSKQQSEHLNSLRSSVTKLQAEINTFLTQKMEEDKGTVKAEDAKAEENYGEENPDDDEDGVKASSGTDGNVK